MPRPAPTTAPVLPADVDEQITTAIQMRAEGHSYSAIAATVGRSYAWVKQVLVKAAADILADRDAYFTQAVAEMMWLKKRIIAPYVGDADGATTRKMDPKDAAILIKTQERLARLLGLDQPVKVEGKFDFSGKSDDELAALALANGLAPLLADAPAPETPDEPLP